MILRPYQFRACEQARRVARAGARAICIVGPCGLGKTAIACELARTANAKGSRLLFLVHRHELAEQARARLTVPAVVTTIQSLLASGERPPAEVVVWDEIHHAPAAEWSQLARDYSGSMLLGLTATPQRADGRALGDICDAMVIAATYSELLAGGWIVPAEGWRPTQVQRGGVLANSPIEMWNEHARGQRTICFAGDVDHAVELAGRWRMAGVAAESVDGEMPAAKRAAVLGRFRSGETTMLCNVFIATEGYDLPEVECIVLARGFSHDGPYLQATGRALRPAPGKTHATIIDLTGATHQHGMPHEDREYSLAGRAIGQSAAVEAVPMRQCKWCGAVWRGNEPLCPRCGRQVARPKTRRERHEALERMRAGATEDSKRAAWLGLLREAEGKGYKKGWAFHRFFGRFQCQPPREQKT